MTGRVPRSRPSVHAVLPLALAFAGAAFAQAADTPPTRPGNLAGRIYPGAGGEILWRRSSDDRGVRGYEIVRNGRSLGIVDALSLYDPDLRADVGYTFTVTAIDTAGQRSAPASVSINGGGGGPVVPGTAAPAPPADLVAERYSGNAGELQWTRPTAFGLSYEVRRDGELVASTDGVSHHDAGLVPGIRFAYEVVAIDRGGRRSVPSSVTLDVAGGSAPAPGAPAAPRDASLQVYSDTAAELFWTRSPSTERIVRTEVERDGVALGTTPGNSFFDDARVPGTTYRYALTAVSASGARSDTTLVDDGNAAANPARPGGAILSDTTYEAVLEESLLVANALLRPPGGALGFEEVRLAAQDLLSASIAAAAGVDASRGLAPISVETGDGEFATVAELACTAGGTVTLRRRAPRLGGGELLEADACGRLGTTFDGGYETVDASDAFTYRYRGVSHDPGNGTTLALDGTLTTGRTAFAEADADSVRWEVERYRTSGVASPVDIEDLRLESIGQRRPGVASAPRRQTVRFTYRSPLTGPDGFIDASTPMPFEQRDPSAPNYETGQLLLQASDGSSLLLDAASGDPGTFRIALTFDSGTLGFDVPWQDGRFQLR